MAKTFPTESSPSPFNSEEGQFFKVVKLKTGESLLCSMPKNITSVASEMFLTMVHPVQCILTRQMTKNDDVVAEMFILRPWLGVSDSEEFDVTTDIVLTVGNMRPIVKRQYLQYLREFAKAQKMIQTEAETEEMENAIHRVLTDANDGQPYRIVPEGNPRTL